MVRRLLVLLTVLALTPVVARAEDKAKGTKPSTDAQVTEAARNQEQLARLFRELEHSLLRLAQRLEASGMPTERDKALTIRKALAFANDEGVELKFSKLIHTLSKNEALQLDDLKDAMAQNKVVVKDIQAILAILTNDDDAKRKAERDRLSNLLQELDRVIRAEKLIRAKLEAGRGNKDDLAKAQRAVTETTEKIAKEIRARNNPDSEKAEKDIQNAIGKQKDAEGKIGGGNMPGAGEDIDAAIPILERVRDRLHDELRQHRQEERERLLAKLLARCERMLALQAKVYDGTMLVQQAIDQCKDKKPTRVEEQQARLLADQEEVILTEADAVIRLLEEEGTAVAFLEVFRELRGDMKNVKRRLMDTDVGVVTQGIEKDIMDTLREMIGALKKNREAKPPDGGDGPHAWPPPKPPLVELVSELKLLRSMQVRVNQRTKVYGEQYPGEQAKDPAIQEELKTLAEHQRKLYETTKKIATKMKE